MRFYNYTLWIDLLANVVILVMAVLFGLAMDYQLFLVTGMREAFVHGVPARTAVVAGLRNGRAVVTAAAIIMVSSSISPPSTMI